MILVVSSKKLARSIIIRRARWAHLDPSLLETVSNRIMNEVSEVSRVAYDISSKPPATIEWE